jgi:hypothetical protein
MKIGVSGGIANGVRTLIKTKIASKHQNLGVSIVSLGIFAHEYSYEVKHIQNRKRCSQLTRHVAWRFTPRN